MKGSPIEPSRGNSLRTEIYNSISRNKLATTTKLLRNTLASHLKFPSFKPEMRTEIFSPAPRTETSIHKMSRSVNDTLSGGKGRKQYRSDGRPKEQAEGKGKVEKVKAERAKVDKVKSKSQIILKSRSPKQKSQSQSQKTLVQGHPPRQKAKDRIRNKLKEKGGSMSKSCRKINLESIIEQSSSEEQLVTPSNKGKARVETPLSQSRTKKKQQHQSDCFSEGTKRRIDKSFKEPQTFQKVLKTPLLTVSYRILKKRLIEVEVYTLKSLRALRVTLEKGNLECQSIVEEFSHVSANTVLALFSSVRNIDLDSVCTFPQLEVEMEEAQGEEKVRRSVVVPYSWLHFCEDRPPSLKRSKIKTKVCLSDVPISSSHLNILSCVFQTWLKRSLKGQSEFETSFCLCQQDYSIKLVEEVTERFTLQLEGKGEARLTNMIHFIQRLIS